MPKRRGRPQGRHRIGVWLRRIVWLMVGIVLLTVLMTVSLRWVDPPTSAFMLAHGWQHGPVTHEWRPWGRINPRLALSVIASEDQRFADHHGFDLEAIEKALEESEESGRLRGASTISQQLAKNLFLWSGRNFVRKGMEAYFTMLLELFLPKRRILELYLNSVEFGTGVYGAQAAATRYFGRDASDLTPRQAALLAARLPNPRDYRIDPPSPYMERRVQWILEQIDQLGGEQYLARLEQ